MSVEFFAPGRPATKGSTRSFMSPQGRLVTTGMNPRTKAWQGVVACAAQMAGVQFQAEGPVALVLEFVFARPKGHRTSKGALSRSATSCPVTRSVGDLDKTVRACLDALSGVAFRDDSQVCALTASKRWAVEGEGEGVRVVVS